MVDDTLRNIHNYVGYSGIREKIVGIAANGVPIYQGTSELKYDAFFPKAYNLYRYPKAIDVDACLGHSAYSGYYHYYSFSPCIFNTAVKSLTESTLCSDDAICKQNVTAY